MAAPFRSGQALGWLTSANATTVTVALSATANWYAFAFVADSARTLSTVRAFVSAVTGTLGASDVTCDLYDSTGTSGAPGSTIETGKVPTATITASGWYTFSGFTTSLTAGQMYWLVFKNANIIPASNFPTFRTLTFGGTPQHLLGTATRQFWARGSSTNSGSTWTVTVGSVACRVGYADGTFDGIPASNTASAAVGDGVYGTRESGVKFTSPANAVLNVAGLALTVATKTGSPTGSPRLGLWTGSTPALQAYTNTIPATAITATQWVYSYFASNVVLQPNTVCRVTLGETTQSDASGNRWNGYEFTWDADSNSLILLPMNGTAVKTYFDGSSWSDTSGSLFGFALLLDTAGEFGGGGMLYHTGGG